MWDVDYLERVYAIVDGLNARFADGDEPFRIIARLCEEAGELAAAVNTFEGTGVKRQKHGAPDPVALAEEIRDVMVAALAVARHYSVEEHLREAIDLRYHQLRADGYLTEP